MTHTAGLDGIDLTDLSHFAHGAPHDLYRRLRDDAPLHWNLPSEFTPAGEGFWSLTRHADVDWAAKQPELFSSVGGGDREGGGTLIDDLPKGFAAGVLLNMQDGARHKAIRRLVTPSVSPKRLREIETMLAERAHAIVTDALERGDVDFLVDVAAELPLQAIASLLGVAQTDRHFFLEWADTTLDYDDRNPGDYTERTQLAATKMFEYSNRLFADKRTCPAADITTIIANAELPAEAAPGGPLSELEQQMFFSLLVAAGSETTRNSIAGGVLAFLECPQQWEQLREDRTLMPTAVEEILRFTSATVYNRRTATRDIELHGRQIKAGDKVVLWWQSANFDERVFSAPHQLDIRRSTNPHLAFGAGNHFCLGSNLARTEIRLILEQLLDRVGSLELAGPVERTRSNKHAGYRHIPVKLSARAEPSDTSPT